MLKNADTQHRFQSLLTRKCGPIYLKQNPFAEDSQSIYTIWKLSSSKDKLGKIKETKAENEVRPGTKIDLFSMTWKAVTGNFIKTLFTSNQNISENEYQCHKKWRFFKN